MTDLNKKDKTIRADFEFVKKLRGVRRNRAVNFSDEDPAELKDRELTRMLRNSDGFQQALRELETKRRRKDE